jgi:hypothetical protein
MSHRLQVLIPEELDARIRKAASRDRVSKGEWVRRAIELALREGTDATRRLDPLSRLSQLEGPTADIDQLLGEIEKGRS